MHQKPLGTANTEGFYFGLGCRLFYFFFRPNHLRSIVMISSTMMPDATPANTDRRKEYADNMYTPFLLPEWGGNEGIISYFSRKIHVNL